MRVAYLIFAYRNPKLIGKLIERLSGEDSSFFVHIDRKSDLNEFASLRGRNVSFTERLPVYWAEFSGVQAVLLLLRAALAAPQAHDYFVLLSGSEYPLKSKACIHDFLERHRGSEYISMVKLPNAAAGKPISRINDLRLPSDRPISRFVVRVLAKLGLARRDYRKHLGNLEPYSGNTWWALTREACEHIVDFVEHNPRVVKFFENTFAPEEMFVHTILGNSPFRSRVRRNLVFEDWSAGGSRPEMIGEAHLARFEAAEPVKTNDFYGPGEFLFARKFSDENLEPLAAIDSIIARKEKPGLVPA